MLMMTYGLDLLCPKGANGMLRGYISDLFVVRNNVKCLRGANKLVVPRKKNYPLA